MWIIQKKRTRQVRFLFLYYTVPMKGIPLPSDPIELHFRLTPPQKTALKKLAITRLEDLFFHLPSNYGAPTERKYISELKKGDYATVTGQIVSSKLGKGFVSKIPMAEVVIRDSTSQIKAVWFHQAYMAKKIPAGGYAQISGTVQERKGELYIANPEMQEALPTDLENHGTLWSKKDAPGNGLLFPTYPESRGISSLWIYHAIEKLFRWGLHEKMADPIPKEILGKYHLPGLQTALIWIHRPQKESDSLSARKRFAFEEVFKIQLGRLSARNDYEENPAYSITRNPKAERDFVSRFPFTPTEAQTQAVKQILSDMSLKRPMLRLLEGDVGSGKTAVAAMAAFAAVNSGYEVAYMAPTEILAQQHFESFIKYFSHLGIQIGLITGSECRKFPSKVDPTGHTHISRTQLLKWVANGEIPILIGTHALIQKSVEFESLALVVIDEQHRFGVNQRLTLRSKQRKDEPLPHLLSMTATPIPRTLALTLYGDLDLTLLDQMPAGRKPIITEIVGPDDRGRVYKKMREELRAGRQAYVICPRISEPDPEKELALTAKSVTEEAARLKREVFPEYKISILHGKAKSSEKDAVMSDFLARKSDILVATSVIEVGVNVPNSTIILIEGADRFGLAQLHQLRGRVIRGTHQAYCFAMTESKSKKSKERLGALKNAKNGFELAEHDLKIRGHGELSGRKQWGISDVGMEAIKNLKMVEAARSEAHALLKKDPRLAHNPLLRPATQNASAVHFE